MMQKDEAGREQRKTVLGGGTAKNRGLGADGAVLGCGRNTTKASAAAYGLRNSLECYQMWQW